jgi:hypothetical protein
MCDYGGASGKPALYDGYDDTAIVVSLVPAIETVGRTICLDTVGNGIPSYPWAWYGFEGCSNVIPEWDASPGGHCFVIDAAPVEGVDLAIIVWGSRARPGFGKMYEVFYWNRGNIAATDVEATLILPPEVEYISSDPAGTVVGQQVSWSLGTVGALSSGILKVSTNVPVSAPLGAWIMAAASVSTSSSDVDLLNNQDPDVEEVVASVDPNDKEAQPLGVGSESWIGLQAPLKYTVFFENADTASAEAIYVTVVDTLDIDLDWSTIEFGPVSHGDKCTPSFDPATGVLTWVFDSIMLPPNVNPPEGEGYVSYFVYPRADLVSGDQIANHASIQFDFNPWIYAPTDSSLVIRTIDIDAPYSEIAPLEDTIDTDTFTVSWSGYDNPGGSGIESYDIYVDINGGGDSLWRPGIIGTNALYVCYDTGYHCFYSIAVDSVGNKQTAGGAELECVYATTTNCCGLYTGGYTGNCDCDIQGKRNLTDITQLISRVYLTPETPLCCEPNGNTNGDPAGTLNLADITKLVDYVYISHEETAPCP